MEKGKAKPVEPSRSEWGHLHPSRQRSESSSSMWEPHTDFSESKVGFVIRIDLPGVSKDHIDIEIRDRLVTVTGKRVSDTHSEGHDVIHTERVYGRFSRSITLPRPVSSPDIEAVYENGVLTIRLEKDLSAHDRHIQIE